MRGFVEGVEDKPPAEKCRNKGQGTGREQARVAHRKGKGERREEGLGGWKPPLVANIRKERRQSVDGWGGRGRRLAALECDQPHVVQDRQDGEEHAHFDC